MIALGFIVVLIIAGAFIIRLAEKEPGKCPGCGNPNSYRSVGPFLWMKEDGHCGSCGYTPD